jgi:hypothetical protein
MIIVDTTPRFAVLSPTRQASEGISASLAGASGSGNVLEQFIAHPS